MRLRAAFAAHPRRAAGSVVLLVFGLSRVGVRWAGVQLNAEELGSFWHFIDVDLLTSRLLPSLAVLHGQPPGFNLFLGVGLKLFGSGAAAFYGAVFVGIGALTALLLQALMLELGVRRHSATALACAWCLSPAAILYENLLLYTYPSVTLLLATAWLLVRAERLSGGEGKRAGRWWLAGFATAALLVLTRSLFHPLWLVALWLGAVSLTRGRRRAVVGAGLVPMLFITGLAITDVVRFGTLTTSSWFGMNLARITTFQLDPDVRKRMQESGELSALASLRPFAALERYRGLAPMPEPTGEPLLDRPRKLSGAVNLHHLAYVEISRRYGADARRVMLAAPSAYGRGLLRAGRRFLSPASDYGPLARNRRTIATLESVYNGLFHFELPGLGAVGWMVIALPGLTLFGLLRGFRRWRMGEPGGAGLLVLSATVVWVGWGGCAFAVGENNRFRFLIEPYLLVLAACAGGELGRWWRGRL